VVDLVYRQPLPLRGFDLALTEQLAETMKVQGIRLHPGCAPLRVEARGAARRLTLGNGHAIEADVVFFATGRRPTTRRLGLERAGIATRQHGAIAVDDQFRTNQPSVYAIGDVTDRLNLTPVATAEGHALADAFFARGQRRISLDNVATAVFFSPPLASVGLTEEAAAVRGPADIYETRFTPLRHAVSGRIRRTFMKLVVDRASQRILGAHMLGDDAPEIMQGLSIALTCGATKADFDRTIGIHPTAAEEFVTLRTKTRVVGLAQAAD
jgi:glutathione reductase (NADPH)